MVYLNWTLQMSIWSTLHLIWQVKLVVYSNCLSIYYLHYKSIINGTHMSAYTTIFPPHSPYIPFFLPSTSDVATADSGGGRARWRRTAATRGRGRRARGQQRAETAPSQRAIARRFTPHRPPSLLSHRHALHPSLARLETTRTAAAVAAGDDADGDGGRGRRWCERRQRSRPSTAVEVAAGDGADDGGGHV